MFQSPLQPANLIAHVQHPPPFPTPPMSPPHSDVDVDAAPLIAGCWSTPPYYDDQYDASTVHTTTRAGFGHYNTIHHTAPTHPSIDPPPTACHPHEQDPTFLLDPSHQQTRKLEERRRQNRESAKRSRIKRRQTMTGVAEHVKRQEEIIAALEQKLGELEAIVRRARAHHHRSGPTAKLDPPHTTTTTHANIMCSNQNIDAADPCCYPITSSCDNHQADGFTDMNVDPVLALIPTASAVNPVAAPDEPLASPQFTPAGTLANDLRFARTPYPPVQQDTLITDPAMCTGSALSYPELADQHVLPVQLGRVGHATKARERRLSWAIQVPPQSTPALHPAQSQLHTSIPSLNSLKSVPAMQPSDSTFSVPLSEASEEILQDLSAEHAWQSTRPMGTSLTTQQAVQKLQTTQQMTTEPSVTSRQKIQYHPLHPVPRNQRAIGSVHSHDTEEQSPFSLLPDEPSRKLHVPGNEMGMVSRQPEFEPSLRHPTSVEQAHALMHMRQPIYLQTSLPIEKFTEQAETVAFSQIDDQNLSSCAPNIDFDAAFSATGSKGGPDSKHLIDIASCFGIGADSDRSPGNVRAGLSSNVPYSSVSAASIKGEMFADLLGAAAELTALVSDAPVQTPCGDMHEVQELEFDDHVVS